MLSFDAFNSEVSWSESVTAIRARIRIDIRSYRAVNGYNNTVKYVLDYGIYILRL